MPVWRQAAQSVRVSTDEGRSARHGGVTHANSPAQRGLRPDLEPLQTRTARCGSRGSHHGTRRQVWTGIAMNTERLGRKAAPTRDHSFLGGVPNALQLESSRLERLRNAFLAQIGRAPV